MGVERVYVRYELSVRVRFRPNVEGQRVANLDDVSYGAKQFSEEPVQPVLETRREANANECFAMHFPNGERILKNFDRGALLLAFSA